MRTRAVVVAISICPRPHSSDDRSTRAPSMRRIGPLTLIASAAIASAAQDSAFVSVGDGVVGLERMRRTATLTATKDDIAELLKSALEVGGDGGNTVIEKEEGGEGKRDEVIVVRVNDDNEEQVVADLILLRDDNRESNRPSALTVANRKKKAKQMKTSENESSKTKSATEKSNMTKDGENGFGMDGMEISPTNTIPPEPTKPPTHRPTHRPTQFLTANPSKEPTASDVSSVVDVKMLTNVPPCPPHYNMSAIYVADDTIETKSNIWRCRRIPFEKYCSIAEMKESWSDDKKTLWHDAWAHVSACKKQTITDDDDVAGKIDMEVTGQSVATTATTPITTTIEASTNIASLPRCPSVYVPFKTDYVAGEQVSVKCHIFQCKDEAHEIYCNSNSWDDSMPLDMWKEAWEPVGECKSTQGDMMGDDAADDVNWNCSS